MKQTDPLGHDTPSTRERLIDRPIPAESMSSDVSLDLALLGFILIGSVLPVRHLHSDIPWVWPLLNTVGGGMCILFAILGRRRSRGANLGARTTLAVAACALLYQTVLYWDPSDGGQTRNPRLAVMTIVLAVFSLGTLLKLSRDMKGV
ncbi:MAG: hypothetical protein JNK85_23390 [Verrucomicrobiales bacterium]|nr:hypothetical protein [Verrucomicrobiales bacterium]